MRSGMGWWGVEKRLWGATACGRDAADVLKSLQADPLAEAVRHAYPNTHAGLMSRTP